MARCPVCDVEITIGCNCDVADGISFGWSGTGADDDPFVIDPILSEDVDQLLECDPEGLLALIPDEIINPPSVMTYRTSHLSIANNTLTTVPFTTELYDTDTMHDNTTNPERITFTTAGYYLVTFVCAWNKNIVGDRLAQIRKNGTDVLAMESKRTGGADLLVGHSITIEDSFSAGNYIEARVQQTSGGNLLLLGDSFSPFFLAERMA